MSEYRIFRYRLDIVDDPVVLMPPGAEVLSVGPPRDGTDRLDIWAKVNSQRTIETPDPVAEARHFRIAGTGHPIPDDCGRFIGTVPTHNGALIWHVFEAAS